MRSFFLFRVYAGCGAAVLLLLCACATPNRSRPFDYYMLSLSRTGDGFVLHGLWPEVVGSLSPENCAGPVFDSASVPDELPRIMPGERLMEHEWMTHGTCSGLSEGEYFRTAVRAFRMMKIPVLERENPSEVRRQFAQANADFPSGAFQVKEHGAYLAEVRVCFTTDLRPLACGR
jgi:ribonuclease T2